MTDQRLRELCQKMIYHIEQFEGDEFINVVKGLGFQGDEILDLMYIDEIINYYDYDICILNKEGIKYMTEMSDDNKFHHKISNYELYMWFDKTVKCWVGLYHSSPDDDYLEEFKSQSHCMAWLAGEEDK